jgi:hypothetical protein
MKVQELLSDEPLRQPLNALPALWYPLIEVDAGYIGSPAFHAFSELC